MNKEQLQRIKTFTLNQNSLDRYAIFLKQYYPEESARFETLTYEKKLKAWATEILKDVNVKQSVKQEANMVLRSIK